MIVSQGYYIYIYRYIYLKKSLKNHKSQYFSFSLNLIGRLIVHCKLNWRNCVTMSVERGSRSRCRSKRRLPSTFDQSFVRCSSISVESRSASISIVSASRAIFSKQCTQSLMASLDFMDRKFCLFLFEFFIYWFYCHATLVIILLELEWIFVFIALYFCFSLFQNAKKKI